MIVFNKESFRIKKFFKNEKKKRIIRKERLKEKPGFIRW